MRKILGILPLLFLLTLTVSCGKSDSWKTKNIFISEVHDGDTFNTKDFSMPIRLFAVDTPEANDQFNDFAETTGIEKIYSDKATAFAKQMIENKQVLIKKEAIGRYGRLVGSIQINNKDLGIELVKHGLARIAYIDIDNSHSPYYSKETEYYRKLLLAKHFAYENKLGFWAQEELFKQIFPKS